MTGRSHIVIGLAATATISNGFKGILLFIPFAVLGSLIPDIDTEKKSLIKSNKIIALFVVITFLYLYFNQNNKNAQLGIASTLIICFVYSRTKHRTLSHSLLGLSILILPISLISSTGSFYFVLGYISHLVSDSITVSGVPFFYPLSKKTFGFKICKSSGTIDLIIRILSIGVIAYSFI